MLALALPLGAQAFLLIDRDDANGRPRWYGGMAL